MSKALLKEALIVDIVRTPIGKIGSAMDGQSLVRFGFGGSV